MTDKEAVKILKNEYMFRINIKDGCYPWKCKNCEYSEDKDDVTREIDYAVQALSKQSASGEQADDVPDIHVGKTDFKPGDKFILELGQERRMFGEFEIKGTDLYVRTDLLEKLTRYEP